MNKVFINGAASISPQGNFDQSHLAEQWTLTNEESRLCQEPDYAQWIDAKAARRMSKVLKMGVATAKLALRQAGIERPDGIITGTGLGCLEDTASFLSKMILQEEQSLNPTPFIQSTHNTIGSQIALLIQCLGYNQTYTQDSLSFECALFDAMMWLDEHPDGHWLVGGVDEFTESSHQIMRRLGHFRQGGCHGEGATFFSLSAKQTSESIAKVAGMCTVQQSADVHDITGRFQEFMKDQQLESSEIDLVLIGHSGELSLSDIGSRVVQTLWPDKPGIAYKHYCGEYPTSTAFAMWLGSNLLLSQRVPTAMWPSSPGQLRNLLIYNPYFSLQHSLILLQSL